MQLNKKIHIPQEILKGFKQKINNFNGNKKAKAYITVLNVLENGHVTLSNLKKIKNTIETSNDESVNFLLKDKEFINWYENILSRHSDRIQKNKENKERAGFNNAYRKPHEKTSFIHSESISRNIKVFINENIYNKIRKHGMF